MPEQLSTTQHKPRKWLFLIPLIIAIAVFYQQLKNRSQPEQTPPTEPAKAVRIIKVPQLTVIPRAIGYGTVTPEKTWEAVAEINGRITSEHAKLSSGELIPANEILLTIDITDYELTLAQIATDIKGIEAQLAELEVKETNTRSSLAIETEALELRSKDLQRNQSLAKRGTITRSQLEQEQRDVLNQRQSVQAQQSALNLIPSQRQLLQAQLARSQAQQQSAQLDLDRTTITMPFTGRMANVNIEKNQFVRRGDKLLSADSIAVAEITAQFSLSKIRHLIVPDQEKTVNLNNDTPRRVLDFSATVRLPDDNRSNEWQARFVRASDAVDERTRTVGLVVAVDEPYRQSQPGIRPPLVKGMFVEVELRGQAQADSLVVPRAALHGEQLYSVDDNNRLQQHQVEVAFVQDDFAVIKTGISAGARIVVTDLSPAIIGMLLAPQLDQDLLQQLQQQVSGERL